jgi:hypothetical protein
MDPSRLAELLAVLRDAGVTNASLPVLGADGKEYIGRVDVTFRPLPGAALVDDDTDKPEPEEPLPPGAFDPIARRKQAASG